MIADLLVPARFCGPPSSGNGGWVAGALATALAEGPGPTIEVTLLAPPPLDTPMALSTDGDLTTASAPGGPVAAARILDRSLSAVDPVDATTARAAEQAYAGAASPFPGCFVCGVLREEGDGLRIFSGPVAGKHDLVAATWTPHETSVALAWAALDCPGGWAGGLGERLMVLGRMSVRLAALPEPGEEHVVVGAGRGRHGRKTATATSLYDASGRLVGLAEQVWIEVDAVPSARWPLR